MAASLAEARALWGRRAGALGVGVLGAGAMIVLDGPLPWLLGPMFAGLAVSLAGARLEGPGVIGDGFRAVLGVAIGTSFTPELFQRLDEMALTLALLPVYIAVIAAVGTPYFKRVCGFDGPTAYYSAMPGGLQDMLVFGEEAGAHVRSLSLVHATRVLAIVATLPFLLEALYGAPVAGQPTPGADLSAVSAADALWMLAALFGGWFAALRLGVFGATIVGPLVASAALSLAGLISARPPAEAILAAQLVIGLSVGAKYAGITFSELRSVVLAALGFCAVLTVLAAAFEQLVVALGLAPPLEALLAFAPGGQGEMVILALVVGADVAFVAIHHVVRVFIVILGAPLARRYFDAV